MRLCNREAVEVQIDDGATVVIQAGQPPIINGVPEKLMRVGCGSATIGMFAKQWLGQVDEVVVVDDHITGVLSEHQAGRLLEVPPTGIRMKGRRSTPGRYFQVARARHRLGRHRYRRPADDPETLRCQGGLAGPAAADGLDHRRAMGLLRARRRTWCRDGRGPRRRARLGRADRRKLRAVALFGAVHGRRGRQPAGRGHHQPGPADPVGQGRADLCHLRRGDGLSSGPAAASP